MVSERKQPTTLFVDRTSRQWILRDAQGRFWLIPPVEDPWEQRVPFAPSEDAQLEPIPGHYIRTLGLPISI